MSTITFLMTSLIIVLIPGTDVIYTVSVGLIDGKKNSIFAALGCTAGIIPHLCLSIALSSFLMQINSKVFSFIKYAGILYLIYMGMGMIFTKEKIQFTEIQTAHNAMSIIRRGIFINLLNPKLTLFFFSFLPQYVRPDSHYYLMESVLLGLLFMLLTLVVFVGYGILAGVAKVWICRSPGRITALQRCFGLVFIGFAVKLAFES